MESAAEDLDYWAAVAALEWHLELGADEPMLEHPLDCFSLPERLAVAKPAPEPARAQPQFVPMAAQDPVALARQVAGAAADLEQLRAALEGFEHCALRKGARNLVFADGALGARVLVLTEPPNREDDLAGRPLTGREGVLFEAMFAAIGLSRAEGLYILPAMPWRPLTHPEPADLEMLAPFVERHIELAAPEVVVLLGNTACALGLGQSSVLRQRGQWGNAFGHPCLPMLHPSYLMSNTSVKRETWADLLALKAALG